MFSTPRNYNVLTLPYHFKAHHKIHNISWNWWEPGPGARYRYGSKNLRNYNIIRPHTVLRPTISTLKLCISITQPLFQHLHSSSPPFQHYFCSVPLSVLAEQLKTLFSKDSVQYTFIVEMCLLCSTDIVVI